MGGRKSKYAPDAPADLLFRVKRMSKHSSSGWRSIKAVQSKTVSLRSRRGLVVQLYLNNSDKPDLILRDTTGNGCYDSIEHRGSLGLSKVLGEYSSGGFPMLALDTTEDGKADTIVFDSSASSRYDRIVARSVAPLSFFPTMAKASGDNSSVEDAELHTGLWSQSDSQSLGNDNHPLAPGWEKRMSVSKNRFYYVNKDQQKQTWEAEVAELPPWPSTPTESPTKGENLRSRSVTEDDDAPSSLPIVCVKSKSKGKDYYVVGARSTWSLDEAERIVNAAEHPIYWKHAGKTSDFIELVHTKTIWHHVQMLLASTFLCIRTRDRKTRLPEALEAVKIWRVENANVWKRYKAHRDWLKKVMAPFGNSLSHCNPPPKTSQLLTRDLCGTLPQGHQGSLLNASEAPPKLLDASIGEVYLFHGTSPHGALGIVDSGFDVTRAEKTACYGPGIYFAECSSKSDEYASQESDGIHAGHCVMLLCRVLLGRVLHWETEFSFELQKAWEEGNHDSILGDRAQLRGTYREFVLPPESGFGAYPEYVVLYKRRYEDF